ncbi:MAG: hypothetical protein GX376_00940 [Firmicutes bacterium]|nr:hypothetical protein [Bacillota bacterium]
MSRRLSFILIVIGLLCLMGFWQPGSINAAGRDKRVIVFVLDSISITDLCAAMTPTIDMLIDVGAMGLMNTSTYSGSARNAAHLTIGAGARASGGDGLEPALEIGEEWGGIPAGEVYRNRMGLIPGGNIVHLGMAEIIAGNSGLAATVLPGALGQTLADAGYTSSLLGNSDVPGMPRRPAAGIVIDFTGVVKDGAIGSDLLGENATAPYGLETNINSLLGALHKTTDSSLLVIEWGDTARVDGYSRYLLPEVAVAARRRAVERADEFLGELLKGLDLEETLLLLLTPSPAIGGYQKGERLTPIIMAGAGTGTGLLSSPTTRRAGLVANVDVAPTIIRFFQLAPPSTMMGRPMKIVPGDNAPETLSALGDIFQRNFAFRPIVIRTYIIFIIAVLAGTTGAIYRPGRWNSLGAQLLIAVAAVPLILLLLPLLALRKLDITLLVIAITTFLLVKLVYRKKNNPQPFIVLGLLTVGLLWLDLVLGQSLLLKSLLGYCPISGARYYGMGNEYMGLYLGAGLIGWSGLAGEINTAGRRINPFFIVLPGYLFLLLFIASPRLGANFGGTIATMWGGGTTIICLQKQRARRRQLLIWVLGGVLLLIALGWGDYSLAGDGASHLGRTIGLIIGAGPRELLLIIQRKVGMNLKLLKYSWWSLVILAVLILFILLSYRPPRLLKDLAREFPALWAGFIGSGIGAFVAFLVNDSGVVAGATVLIFPVTTLLFLLLQAGGKT